MLKWSFTKTCQMTVTLMSVCDLWRRQFKYVRFHVLTAASMFRIVFWDVLPCKIIVDRRFRGAYCLLHQTSQKTILNSSWSRPRPLPRIIYHWRALCLVTTSAPRDDPLGTEHRGVTDLTPTPLRLAIEGIAMRRAHIDSTGFGVWFRWLL
jgi:hypothetical protein